MSTHDPYDNRSFCLFLLTLKRYRINGLMLSVLIAILVLVAPSCTRRHECPPPPVLGPDVVVDIKLLQPEVPTFYTYPYQGKKINFFVLKINDKVSAFLDACITCNPHKQGYRYADGSVTCRYCNMNFSIFKLEKGIGGCYPIKVEGRMHDAMFLIPRVVLEAAADRF